MQYFDRAFFQQEVGSFESVLQKSGTMAGDYLMMIMLYNLFNHQQVSETKISYTEFLGMVEKGHVAEVVIQGQDLFVTDENRNRYKIYAPPDADLIKTLRQRKGDSGQTAG